MTRTLSLASAGFVATAVAFGPARMGFGLFLPTFRESFALSSTQAGVIASLGFLAFFLALPLTAWLDERIGQRVPIVVGALSAAVGFIAVAIASSPAMLAAGIALAGASAGFCWAPFIDAAERVVASSARGEALSAVSTGTTVGVAAAGALFVGVAYEAIDWRLAWLIFALVALLAAAMVWRSVPGGRAQTGARPLSEVGLLRRAAMPLYAAAVCFGACNAVYLSFAADHVVASGGLPGLPERAASAVIFLGYGIFGLLGLATGRMEARLGLEPLLGVIFTAFAASLVLVALTPASWTAIILSAGLHGAAVMTISAVLSFWSLRLFPGHGSLGLTAVLIAVAASSVISPALTGSLAGPDSLTAAFLLTAAIPLAAALLFAGRAVLHRP